MRLLPSAMLEGTEMLGLSNRSQEVKRDLTVRPLEELIVIKRLVEGKSHAGA